MSIDVQPTSHKPQANFMRRALELAALGRGAVSPNPLVGCVIVHQDQTADRDPRIIGEGWHRQYGGPHAEVNAVRSILPGDEHLLPEATVYVTLEPCAHWGKTPPCADLLIEKRVKKVIICNEDPFPLVDGRGIGKLRAAGIEVEIGLLAAEGREINRRFFTAIEKKRPYIFLKWAETADGFIAAEEGRAVKISSDLSHRLVHRWRSEEDAIMVGTNTARLDNPRLNVRLWAGPGSQPTRIVVDKRLELSTDLHVFDGSQPTLVYHLTDPSDRPGEVTYQQLNPDQPFLPQLLDNLHHGRIQSVLVEGGARLLQSFIDANLWDEMAVFKSPLALGTGIAAPVIRGQLVATEQVSQDELRWFKPL